MFKFNNKIFRTTSIFQIFRSLIIGPTNVNLQTVTPSRQYFWKGMPWSFKIVNQMLHSSHPSPFPWVMGEGGRGGGGLSHFSECLHRRDLRQIEILGRNWHFRRGWFFSGRTWKLCIKDSEYESQGKKWFQL